MIVGRVAITTGSRPKAEATKVEDSCPHPIVIIIHTQVND